MRSRLQVIVGSVALGATGAVFVFFGLEFIRFGAGGILIGTGFVLMGTLSGIMTIIWGWRGHLLGVEVKGETVIVHHYFSKRVIPLSKIKSISRGAEGISMHTSEGAEIYDDSYFDSPTSCDVFYETLTTRLHADVSAPKSLPSRLTTICGITKFVDAALWLLGSCAFLLFGFDRLLHRLWISGVVFSGIGLAIAFLFRPKAK